MIKKMKDAKKEIGKEAISIRIDMEILNFFRKSGEKWQSRINDILREYMLKSRK